jgi:hypothetical protein
MLLLGVAFPQHFWVTPVSVERQTEPGNRKADTRRRHAAPNRWLAPPGIRIRIATDIRRARRTPAHEKEPQRDPLRLFKPVGSAAP